LRWVIKKNPWLTIDPKRAKATCILARTPPWSRGRAGLAARPRGIKAMNDIFAYVAGQLDDIHPKYRIDIMELVMQEVGEAARKERE